MIFMNTVFDLAKNRLVNEAVFSVYAVLKLVRKHNLFIKCLLGLFDKMVTPILLYGCGIWGLRNNDKLDKLNIKSIKFLEKNIKRNCFLYYMANANFQMHRVA